MMEESNSLLLSRGCSVTFNKLNLVLSLPRILRIDITYTKTGKINKVCIKRFVNVSNSYQRKISIA